MSCNFCPKNQVRGIFFHLSPFILLFPLSHPPSFHHFSSFPIFFLSFLLLYVEPFSDPFRVHWSSVTSLPLLPSPSLILSGSVVPSPHLSVLCHCFLPFWLPYTSCLEELTAYASACHLSYLEPLC